MPAFSSMERGTCAVVLCFPSTFFVRWLVFLLRYRGPRRRTAEMTPLLHDEGGKTDDPGTAKVDESKRPPQRAHVVPTSQQRPSAVSGAPSLAASSVQLRVCPPPSPVSVPASMPVRRGGSGGSAVPQARSHRCNHGCCLCRSRDGNPHNLTGRFLHIIFALPCIACFPLSPSFLPPHAPARCRRPFALVDR